MGTGARVRKTWSVTPQTCMIRVDFIISAQVFNTYPREPIGFKENASEEVVAVASPLPSNLPA